MVDIYQDVNDVDGRRLLPHSALLVFDDNAAVIQIAATQTTIVIISLLSA
jgi:hypothetical protein